MLQLARLLQLPPPACQKQLEAHATGIIATRGCVMVPSPSMPSLFSDLPTRPSHSWDGWMHVATNSKKMAHYNPCIPLQAVMNYRNLRSIIFPAIAIVARYVLATERISKNSLMCMAN